MVHVRTIDPDASAEIELVATRMRETLIEVLGEERGASMYTMEWLRDRVRFHLGRTRSTGEVFVAEGEGGQGILGHVIVRIDRDDNLVPIGLFSTIYVQPDARRSGIASKLVSVAERWIDGRSLARAMTYTSDTNVRLMRLFEKHGYHVSARFAAEEMVRLEKVFSA